MKLNLGCGFETKEGYVNLDMVKFKGCDVVHDLNKFPYPFKDNTFDEIIAYRTLDHLNDYFGTMKELYRITKPNGIIKIRAPFYNSTSAASPTHNYRFTYLYFWTFLPHVRATDTPEEKILKGDCDFEIIKFEAILNKYFKFIPNIKWGRDRHLGLRYAIGKCC